MSNTKIVLFFYEQIGSIKTNHEEFYFIKYWKKEN